ncbi:hypothetical protein ACJJTC_016355 [Scirpophaga incertulas]
MVGVRRGQWCRGIAGASSLNPFQFHFPPICSLGEWFEWPPCPFVEINWLFHVSRDCLSAPGSPWQHLGPLALLDPNKLVKCGSWAGIVPGKVSLAGQWPAPRPPHLVQGQWRQFPAAQTAGGGNAAAGPGDSPPCPCFILNRYFHPRCLPAECRPAGVPGKARDVARGMCSALRARQLAVPRDMRRACALLHSYILVRTHVKRGRHDLAARLLLRTAADVSFFPTLQHQVSILTSTVIECGRAGLKHQAQHWARVLMQPEYRLQIDQKYIKKIESVVRHAPREPAAIEPTSPCPVCEAATPVAALRCGRCEAELPMCLASGLHIVKDDLTACPECDFPAIFSEFREILQDEGKCPMCGEIVDFRRLVKIDDVALYLDHNTTE